MKKTISILLSVFLISLFALPVFAEESVLLTADITLVHDGAAILSDRDAEIREKVLSIAEKYGHRVMVVTNDSSEGMDRYDYAKDTFERSVGKGTDGLILYVCMEEGNRGWVTVAEGACKDLYTEDRVNYVDDAMEPYMVEGQYAEGVLAYLEATERAFEDPSVLEKKKSPITTGAIALLGGLIPAAIVTGKKKSRSVIREAATAKDAYVEGSLTVSDRINRFLYKDVRTVAKQQESGGSDYRSDSDSSGGGRSF